MGEKEAETVPETEPTPEPPTHGAQGLNVPETPSGDLASISGQTSSSFDTVPPSATAEEFSYEAGKTNIDGSKFPEIDDSLTNRNSESPTPPITDQMEGSPDQTEVPIENQFETGQPSLEKDIPPEEPNLAPEIINTMPPVSDPPPLRLPQIFRSKNRRVK